MPDAEQNTLAYATPDAIAQRRLSIPAIASIVVAVLAALFAALMCFREGLTNAQADEQMMIGRVGGIVGGVLAVALALISYRRASSHAISHVAITLSIAAILYIVTQLPPCGR